jgi:hypothetical protein
MNRTDKTIENPTTYGGKHVRCDNSCQYVCQMFTIILGG